MKKYLLSVSFIVILGSFAFAGHRNTNRTFIRVQNQQDSIITDIKNMPKYGKDSIKSITNISLYREFYKQWKNSNYKSKSINDVIGPWRWVFFNCPKGTQNTYIDGVRIVKYLINNEQDEAKREKLIDTLMMVYDQRILYFDRKGYVLGRKGVDLYQLRPKESIDAYNTLKKSVELQGNKSKAAVLVYFLRATIKYVKQGNADKSLIVDNYDKISDIISYNIKYSKRPTPYKNIQGAVENDFSPFASCEDLVAIYSKKFKENPDDINLLKKITKKLNGKGCTKTDLFFKTTEKLNKLEPTSETSYLMGKMLIKKGNYPKAAEYLIQSLGLLKDNDKKAEAYYLLANIYLNLKQYQKGRSFAYKGLKLKPDDGNFYIVIGDMYAASSKNCGDNDLTKKVAYWAAVDKYNKAKKVDPSVLEIANKRIKIYSAAFPSMETIFFYDLKEGEPYTVGCWINEKTTVRAAK